MNFIDKEDFFPTYSQNTDYATNAPSFYEYLSRNNRFMKLFTDKIVELNEILIAEFGEFKDLTGEQLTQFNDRLNGIKEEMKLFFKEWVKDGTLEELINESLFTNLNNKVDGIKAKNDSLDLEMKAAKAPFPTLKGKLDSDSSKITSLETDLTLLKTTRKQIESGIIHLKDFPKLPGENDAAHINRALQALPNKQGKVILESKTYTLTNSIVMEEYQTLEGAGHSTVLNNQVPKSNIIVLSLGDTGETYVYGVKIKDLTIKGNGTNTGIHLKSCSHIHLSDLTIYETEWGLWADSSWLCLYDRITIRNYITPGNQGVCFNAGTSNVFNNVWVKNFAKGFETRSIYSVLNGCACDTFTEFAYYNTQTTTLNSCGAEEGYLTEGGFVFGSAARPVVYNACETLAIHYSGVKNKASFFYLDGGKVICNGFRSGGSVASPNLAIFILTGDAYLQDTNTFIQSVFDTKYSFKKGDTERQAIAMEFYAADIQRHRWNGTKKVLFEGDV